MFFLDSNLILLIPIEFLTLNWYSRVNYFNDNSVFNEWHDRK